MTEQEAREITAQGALFLREAARAYEEWRSVQGPVYHMDEGFFVQSVSEGAISFFVTEDDTYNDLRGMSIAVPLWYMWDRDRIDAELEAKRAREEKRHASLTSQRLVDDQMDAVIADSSERDLYLSLKQKYEG